MFVLNSNLLSWEEAVLWLRDQPGLEKLVLDCFFDDPLTDAATRYWNSTEWRAIGRYLPEARGKALDVGAGRGIAAYALARDGWSVTASEPDPSNLVGAGAIRVLAHETGAAIDVVEAWGESLPFADATFEVVHFRQVLHHARDLLQLCREAGRVLKPGGVFIATREHVISRREDLAGFLEGHALHRLYGGENALLLKEYKDAIRQGGIKIERVLNARESDINLFPDTVAGVRKRVAARLGLPFPSIVPRLALKVAYSLSNKPGRLYTFVGRKPARR